MDVKRHRGRRKPPTAKGGVVVDGSKSAVAKFLNDPFVAICRSEKPVTEREYVLLFLEAVNTGELPYEKWINMLGGGINIGVVKGVPSVPLNDLLIGGYRTLLDEFLSANRALTDQHKNIAHSLSYRVAAVPRFQITPGGLTITHQIIGQDNSASLGYAFVLLLAKFSKDVHRCPSCKKFFLAESALGKKKQREYCTADCRKAQLKNTAKDRVQASRAGLTAQQWRDIKAIDPEMSPAGWLEIKAKTPRITVEKWIVIARKQQ